MSGLGGALSSAQRSLASFGEALALVQTNISNAATPGYARQRASLAPIITPNGATQTGVEIADIESLRSELFDRQVLAAKQAQGRLAALSDFFATVEPTFRLDGRGGVDQALDAFFTAAAGLATNPNDLNLRSQLISSADQTAGAFRRADDDLARQAVNLDTSIRDIVGRVNGLLGDLASLERQRNVGDPKTPNAGVETREQQALEQLSDLVGVDLLRQHDGTLSLVAGSAALLTGVVTRPLSLTTTSEGLRVLDAGGHDITAGLLRTGGRLAGALEARNTLLPGLHADLDRLAKSFADNVNQQLGRGVDLTGTAGAALFDYRQTAVTGSGRTAGLTGTATPGTAPSVTVTFAGDVNGVVTASLDTFVAGAAPPTASSAGDTVTLHLTSADGAIDRTITTAPLTGSETAADLAARLNDGLALDPQLAGLVTVSVAGGALKVTLDEQAGQGFTLEASTSNPGFTTGLEAGGALGGQSAEEIAAALNAQVALQQDLTDAGIRFAAVGGEIRLDGDVKFDYTAADSDPDGTGFASGLDGAAGSAGGGGAAGTLEITGIRAAQLAAAAATAPGGNQNANALLALADAGLLDGSTFNEFYSHTVTDLGEAGAQTLAQADTQEQVTAAAEGLRDSLSAVDLNEEAVELTKFEEGYSAMLRVIQVINGLTDEVLGLIR